MLSNIYIKQSKPNYHIAIIIQLSFNPLFNRSYISLAKKKS